MKVIKAAGDYFLGVFAVGVVLGAVRELVIAPRVGDVIAVSVEVVLMLMAAWQICGWVLRRQLLPYTIAGRVMMGLLSFVLLAVAEFCLAIYVFEKAPGSYLAELRTTAGTIGLLAQTLFAVFPLIQKGVVPRPEIRRR